VPLDTLDFTSDTMNLGSKMVIDAQSHARPVGSRRECARRPAAGRIAHDVADLVHSTRA
jgi:3-polyprenyl-4-hydroxybenzoate decarboxylase